MPADGAAGAAVDAAGGRAVAPRLLRDAERPGALAVRRLPDRTHGAIVSALHAHGINRGRPDASPGLRRSSTMLTVEQVRWLERRYGRGRRSEGLRDLIDAAMAAEHARLRADQGGAAGVAGQRPAAPLRALGT